MSQPMKLYLSEQDVLACLPMSKAIELVESAFQQLAEGTAINHPRRRVILPTGSVLHYMAAGTPDYFGLKAYSAHPKTGAHFEVLLYRSADALPLATLEANHLGQIRTGAASGVATKYLARPMPATAGIIGSGFQAETQLEAVAHVRQLKEVRVWSRNAEKRAAFAQRCGEKFGLNIRAVETRTRMRRKHGHRHHGNQLQGTRTVERMDFTRHPYQRGRFELGRSARTSLGLDPQQIDPRGRRFRRSGEDRIGRRPDPAARNERHCIPRNRARGNHSGQAARTHQRRSNHDL